ncbi:T9SS-dependent choice-of-anchor J family protein [Flavobacterium collinsii]|uniref:T9SS-dependent choice-of-anchor J family protein n=1 Tax=Flavobacterium collinsii TaxID=1114861 RepID=UPI00249335B5|nr:T9SS type A sorting domain-containing protein [Flavobacterium collinsii]
MKKTILLFVLAFISVVSSAQVTVWEDNFDDADLAGWTLLDRDEDGINWIARKNINLDESGSAIVDGEHSILGNYLMNLDDLSTVVRLVENWAITPVINLSQHSGKKLQLVLNAQTSIYDTNQDLLVYGSTSKDPDTFTLLSTLKLQRQTELEAEFKDYSVDISQYAGESVVYLAVSNVADENLNFIGFEIDKVSIVAGGNLGIGDHTLDKNRSFLAENPVKENLELQLADQFKDNKTALKIYNAAGNLVKEVNYNNQNISVSDLPQGFYFLLITNNTNSQTIKFIKK